MNRAYMVSEHGHDGSRIRLERCQASSSGGERGVRGREQGEAVDLGVEKLKERDVLALVLRRHLLEHRLERGQVVRVERV